MMRSGGRGSVGEEILLEETIKFTEKKIENQNKRRQDIWEYKYSMCMMREVRKQAL